MSMLTAPSSEGGFLIRQLPKLFRSFEKEEIKQFKKFLNSPFFNNSKPIISFFEFIKDNLHIEDVDEFWAVIYKLLYKKEKNKDINQLLNRLRKKIFPLAEKFIVVNHLKTNDFFKVKINAGFILLEFYYKRKLPEFFKRTWNKLESLQNSNRLSNSIEPNEQLFKLHEYAYRFSLNTGEKKKIKQHLDLIFSHYHQYDLWFKMLYYNGILSQEIIFPIVYDKSWRKQLQEATQPGEPLANDPLFLAYYSLINITEKDTTLSIKEQDTAFYNLFDLLLFLLKENNVSTFYLRQLFNGATNYCSLQINKGRDNFNQPLFQLYQKAIDIKLLLSNKEDESVNKDESANKDELPHFHYMKAIIAGLKVGVIEQSEQIAKDNKEQLASNKKVIWYPLAQASIYFYAKKYKDAIDQLNDLQGLLKNSANYILENIFCKRLILQICYEKKEFYDELDLYKAQKSEETKDDFSVYLENFQRWIRENEQVASINLVPLKMLIDYTLKLYRLEQKSRQYKGEMEIKEELVKMKTEIVGEAIIEKQWLLDRVEDLIKEN